MTQAKSLEQITIAAIVSSDNHTQVIKRVERKGTGQVNRKPSGSPASSDQLNKLLDKFAK